jgi:hypothetical protein
VRLAGDLGAAADADGHGLMISERTRAPCTLSTGVMERLDAVALLPSALPVAST